MPSDNPIDLNKVFNFSDTTPIDQVIEKTKQLNSVLETMMQTAMKSASSMTQSMQAIQKSIDSLEQEMIQADATTKKGQDTIAKGAETTAKAVQQNEEYKKSINEMNTVIAALQEQIVKLQKTKDDDGKKTEAQTNSLADLKKQLKDLTDAYVKMGEATDSSVKGDTLKKIAELSKTINDNQRSVNDAKKGVDLANGSYNELARKVADAAKQLKAMEGGVGSNSEQFKNLQKFVADGNKRLLEFDKAIGDSRRQVGNYEIAAEGLSNQFEGLLSKLGPSGEAIATIGTKAGNAAGLIKGLGTGFLGLTSAVGAFVAVALENYFTRTSKGALELFEITTELEYKYSQFKNVMAEVGGAIFEAFKQQPAIILLTKTWTELEDEQSDAFLKNQLALRKMVKEGIALKVEAAKEELEKNELLFKSREKLLYTDEERLQFNEEAYSIQQNISKKDEDLAKRQLTAKINQILLDKEYTSIVQFNAKERAEVAEYEIKVVEAQQKAYEGTRRIQAQKIQLEEEIYNRERELDKQLLTASKEINSGIVQSDIEKNNAILSNLKSSETAKLNALKQNALDEIKIAKNATELSIAEAERSTRERLRAKAGAANFDAYSPVLQDALIKSDELFQQQKLKIEQDFANKSLAITNKLQTDTTSLVNEKAKQRLESAKIVFEQEQGLKKSNYEADIVLNDKIIQSQGTTLEQKLDAEIKSSDDRVKILETERDKAINAAKTEYASKVQVYGDLRMFEDELIAKQEAAESDFNAKKIANAKNTADKLITLAIDTQKKIAQTESQKAKIGQDQSLIELDESFKNREISILKYNRERAKLERQGKYEILQQDINGLEQQKSTYQKTEELAKKHANDIIAIDEQITAKKKEQADLQIELEKQKTTKIYELEKQLGNAVLDTISSISQNETQTKTQAIDDQIAALQERTAQEIALAGDNQAAKDRINAREAAQEKQLNDQKRKLVHDEAVFQKRMNEAKIIMNTAVQISENLYNPIAVALISALGALELAVVESTPIPAYAKGVDSSKEGLALVAEEGPELGIDRGGNLTLYKEKQITYLTEGTKILNNSKTEPLLDKMNSRHMDITSRQLVDIGIKDIRHGSALNAEIINRLDKLTETTRKNKPAYVNYARTAGMIWEYKTDEATYVKRTKSLSFGNF